MADPEDCESSAVRRASSSLVGHPFENALMAELV